MEVHMEPRQRKNLRLKGYDYASNGVYHVTMCTYQQTPWLSRIEESGLGVLLTSYGQIVEKAIRNIPSIYSFIQIKNYVIMPNHVHLLLHFKLPDTAQEKPTLSTVIGQAKRFASIQAGHTLWQRSFHENIISNRAEYENAMHYIDNNPVNWPNDDFYVTLDYLQSRM